MTNLNSYTIENHLYTVSNEYSLKNETMKIESIISVNDVVFFFCSKKEGLFLSRVSETKSVASKIVPVNAMVFHNLVLNTLNSTSAS